METKKCNECFHYIKQHDPNHVLADRGECWEGPPTPCAIPTNQGIAVQMIRSMVEGETRQCGRFQPKPPAILPS